MSKRFYFKSYTFYLLNNNVTKRCRYLEMFTSRPESALRLPGKLNRKLWVPPHSIRRETKELPRAPAPAQADAALGPRHSQCTPRLRSSRIMPKLACWTERFPYFQLITTNSVLSHVFYHNLQVSHLYDKPFHHFLIRPWDSSNTHCAQVPLYELLLELINWFIVWFMRAVREASHRSPLLEYRSDNAFETFGSLLLLSRNRSP